MKSRPRERRGGHGRRQRSEDLVDSRAHHGHLTPHVLIVMRREPPVRPRVLVLLPPPAVSARRLALETIDVRQIRHHDVPLVRHHAEREEAEEQRLDGESHERQEVGRVIDASRAVVVVRRPPDAVEETIHEEREGVVAREKGVEDEEEEVLCRNIMMNGCFGG